MTRLDHTQQGIGFIGKYTRFDGELARSFQDSKLGELVLEKLIWLEDWLYSDTAVGMFVDLEEEKV